MERKEGGSLIAEVALRRQSDVQLPTAGCSSAEGLLDRPDP